MRKAVYYARVSSSLQEEKGTIDSQRQELKKQIQQNKDLLVDEYVDDGWSGARLDRPDLDRLRADLKTDKFEAVYFLNTDRIARDSAFQNIILSELIKSKKKIIINGKDLENDPDSKFLYTILGAVSELEKAKIIERTTRGRLHKARQGIIMSSHAPFGYDLKLKTENTPTQYIVNEQEATIIKLIFNLYTKEQLSIKGLTKRLYDLKIRARHSEFWRSSSLRRVLTNTTYVGTSYYNKYEGIETENGKKYRANLKNSTRLKDKTLWIPFKTTPIIQKEVFDLAQDLIRHNKQFRRAGSRNYLLSGLLRCSCGGNGCGDFSKGTRTYRCNNRHKQFPKPKTCFVKAIPTNKLEAAVLHCISEKVLSPGILSQHVTFLTQKASQSKVKLKEEIEKLQSQVEVMNSKRAKILDLYADGLINKENIAVKVGELENKEQDLTKQIKELEQKKIVIESRPIVRRSINDFCKLARKRFAKLDDTGMKQFLRLLIEEVLYNEKEVIVKGIVPCNLNIAGQGSQGAFIRSAWERENSSGAGDVGNFAKLVFG